jgi:hypothetical protein
MKEDRLHRGPTTRRWTSQRWLIDYVIRAVGIDDLSADALGRARLLSTMTRCPSVSPSFATTMRVLESVPPPATDDTIMRTGRDG